MKKVFISQGYSYDLNTAYGKAKEYSKQVAEHGHMPVSPVLMFHHVYDNGVDYHIVIGNCFELIRMCDEVWVFDREGDSKGVASEVACAEMLGKKVITIIGG